MTIPKVILRWSVLLPGVLLPLAANAQQREPWSELPPLPTPVSGHFAGVSHGALISVGGAHFPTPLFEGGTKKWLPDINVLLPASPLWMPVSPLAQPLAYGASVSDGKSLICLGGGDEKVHTSAVFRLEWNGKRLQRNELPSLPRPCAFMSAALLHNKIYVVGGQETPASTTAFSSLWALNLKQKNARWRELESLPAAGRILPVVAAQNGALYVFSGASLSANTEGKAQRTYLKDAWCYKPREGWKALAALPAALVAAPVTSWGNTKILVFSGDDGELAARVQELKDKHPGFRREVLLYDTQKDVWSRLDELPVGLVTTNAVSLTNVIIIPGGEDRPGHRNPRVLRFMPLMPHE